MDKYKERLNIIEQSMNDAKYIKNSYQPTLGIKKILKYWFLLYFFSILTFFIVDKANMNFDLYNYSSFYTIYNLYRIAICCFIPIILFICILKTNISLKERRYLKIWLVFPILFCLDNCLTSISYFLNAEILITFYQSFPISSIINIIFLVYLYSYFKNKSFIILIIIYTVYCSYSFYFLSVYFNLIESNVFQTNLYVVMNYFQTYRIVELLFLLVVIIILNRKSQKTYEK